jgi:hypothetical protein
LREGRRIQSLALKGGEQGHLGLNDSADKGPPI